jgi:hypothetical protein
MTHASNTNLAKLMRDAEIVRTLIDVGEQRLLASDGPIDHQLPDLTPGEWKRIYLACKRIAKAFNGR